MNTKTTNRTSRTISRTSNRVTPKKRRVSNPLNQRNRESFNYQATKIGAIKFMTASLAATYMLQKTKLSQSEIARRCGVSQPCVCQLAAKLKPVKKTAKAKR